MYTLLAFSIDDGHGQMHHGLLEYRNQIKWKRNYFVHIWMWVNCIYWKGRLHFLIHPPTSPKQESHLWYTLMNYIVQMSNIQYAKIQSIKIFFFCKSSALINIANQSVYMWRSASNFIYGDANLKKKIKFNKLNLIDLSIHTVYSTCKIKTFTHDNIYKLT